MRQIVLLRGVNLASRNRVSMPELRELLTEAGYGDVQTYVQSGNVVLTSSAAPERVARAVEQHIATGFGIDVDVLVRTRDELAEIVERNPLGDVAKDPKRYQVSFLSAPLDGEAISRLEAVAAPSERLVAAGRELYAWHPAGVARSKLWARLAGKDLGVKATARNWTTVTRLLALADG
jgi:uncharacterized protein (DUF1697 family)